jgi:hypothetical protein
MLGGNREHWRTFGAQEMNVYVPRLWVYRQAKCAGMWGSRRMDFVTGLGEAEMYAFGRRFGCGMSCFEGAKSLK